MNAAICATRVLLWKVGTDPLEIMEQRLCRQFHGNWSCCFSLHHLFQTWGTQRQLRFNVVIYLSAKVGHKNKHWSFGNCHSQVVAFSKTNSCIYLGEYNAITFYQSVPILRIYAQIWEGKVHASVTTVGSAWNGRNCNLSQQNFQEKRSFDGDLPLVSSSFCSGTLSKAAHPPHCYYYYYFYHHCYLQQATVITFTPAQGWNLNPSSSEKGSDSAIVPSSWVRVPCESEFIIIYLAPWSGKRLRKSWFDKKKTFSSLERRQYAAANFRTQTKSIWMSEPRSRNKT